MTVTLGTIGTLAPATNIRYRVAMNDTEPNLHVVSTRTPKEIAQERLGLNVRWQLRELAANLMRVTRGAGKAYMIGRQCAELLEAYDEYFNQVGHYPSDHELATMLDPIDDDEFLDALDDENREMEIAQREMVDGALQITASKLVGQMTQQRAGESQMMDGLRSFVKAREVIKKKRGW